MAQKMALNPNANLNRTKDPFWYLRDDQDVSKADGLFKDGTSEKSNPLFGINNISVTPLVDKDGKPLDKMLDKGAICRVSLDTVIGYVDGITIWNSKNEDGSIYMQSQSRSYEKDGQKKYISDVRLKRQVQAQILRHVSNFLVNALAEGASEE